MSRRVRKSDQKQITPTGAQSFKRSAIAAGIAVAISPAGLQANDLSAFKWGKDWGGNVEVFVSPTSKSRNLMGGQLLQPLWQDSQSMTYFDFRGTVDLGDIEEFNFGLGHRRYFNNDWILGGYASFDTRETERDKRHNQVTFGVEALSVRFDAGFNYYLPVSDAKTIGLGASGGTFVGTKLFANAVMEEALEGYDFELGALLPFVPIGEARLYAGGYDFYGDVAPDMDFGAKVRLEYRPRKDIMIGASVQHDDLFQTEAMLTVNYSFGMPRESGVRTLSERMIQFHQRDIDVKETGQIRDDKMESGDVGDRITVHDGVAHIDKTAAGGGDGSIEKPYNSVAACLAARCGSLNALVYVAAGTYTSTINLADGQQLIGQGYALFGIGGDVFPVLTNSTGVTLANNNEVAGLQFNNNSNGITGSNVTGFNIHHNRLIGFSSRGINLTQTTGTSSGTIANNTFNSTNSSAKGVEMKLSTASNSTATQIVSITDNIINVGKKGLEIKVDVKNSVNSVTTQTVTITGNTITATDEDGIKVDLRLRGTNTNSVVTQTLVIENNQVNGDEQGVEINTRGSGGGRLDQLVTLNGNVITGGDDGLRIENKNDSGGINNQVVDLSGGGNSISGGVDIEIISGTSDNSQIVDLTGSNTVTGGCSSSDSGSKFVQTVTGVTCP